MSKVISLRLKDDQYNRLQRAARRLGRTPSESAVTMLEEALRQREFAFVEFRDSPVGRQAYLQGTRLAVWQVESLARDYGRNLKQMANNLAIPVERLAAALNYAAVYPAEVEAAISDNDLTPETIRQLVPNLEIVGIRAPSP